MVSSLQSPIIDRRLLCPLTTVRHCILALYLEDSSDQKHIFHEMAALLSSVQVLDASSNTVSNQPLNHKSSLKVKNLVFHLSNLFPSSSSTHSSSLRSSQTLSTSVRFIAHIVPPSNSYLASWARLDSVYLRAPQQFAVMASNIPRPFSILQKPQN
jgi:hypothetical protein